MQNFNIYNDNQLNMTVSPICVTDQGERYAYVRFSDQKRSAEGKIPACTIEKNEGFTDAEVTQLVAYMQDNLSTLKSMAAGLNAFKAFIK